MRKPPILGQRCLISRFKKSVNCQSEKQGGCFQSTHCRCIDDSRNKRQSKTYVFTIFRDGIDTVSVSVASSCCPLKGNFTNGNWSRFLRNQDHLKVHHYQIMRGRGHFWFCLSGLLGIRPYIVLLSTVGFTTN